MAEVEFHTGVADPAAFVCRLLRKAYRQGARVLVTAPSAMLAQIDRSLWLLDERDFVPHVMLDHLKPSQELGHAALTPIWLMESLQELLRDPLWFASGAAESPDGVARPSAVVNVGAAAPNADVLLAAPWRWIEVVALDADEATRGRERWRAYKALGLEVVHHKAPLHND